MAINNLKIWEKIGFKKRQEAFDPARDVTAVMMFLDEVHFDIEELQKLFKQLRELRKDAVVLNDAEVKRENVRKQMEMYDLILLKYQYLATDTAVNGIRVKNIAQSYMDEADRQKLFVLLDRVKKEDRWTFDW